MGGRRDKEDPVLTDIVTQRLARLLAENAPRRARGDDRELRPDPGPPDFEPSEDAEDDEHDVRPVSASGRLGRAAPSPEPEVDLLEIDPPSRRSFSRAHFGVVTGLLIVGLVCAGWAVLRARPVAIASTPALAASSAPATPRSTSSGSPPVVSTPSAAPVRILVHVLGAVRKPGVVSLATGARVRDALDAAGGLAEDAAPADLNLAQVLEDGQQVVVGTDDHPLGEVRDPTNGSTNGSTSGSSTGSTGGSAADVVNLNSASQAQLEELPGVGPVTAGKILAWREEHGRFNRVEELQEVDGIGPKTFAQIAPHVRV